MSPDRIKDVGSVCLNVAAGSLVSGFLGAAIQGLSPKVGLALFALSAVWFVGFPYLGLKLKEFAWKDSSG